MSCQPIAGYEREMFSAGCTMNIGSKKLLREVASTFCGAHVWPPSFNHVNDLRTDLRHDVDHGDAGKVRAKRRKAGSTFALYGGAGTPDTIEPVKFPLVQSNILSAIEGDLRGLLLKGF
jgi:hypothetical protein